MVNRTKRTILLILFFTLVIVFPGFSTLRQAQDTANAGLRATPARKDFSGKTSKRDTSLAISVETVARMIKEGKNLILVDVRRPGDFRKLHIPGSVNIPLYAIKTKSFLKSVLVVLVNEGYQHCYLERECRRLEEDNFRVRILDGGLNAWKGKGLKLIGDHFAEKELNRISPAVFYRERNSTGRIILNLSKNSDTISKYLPESSRYFTLPRKSLLSSDEKNIRTLRSICMCGKTSCPPGYHGMPFTTVLVLNEDGRGYDEIESFFKKRHIQNVFFLKGGLKAYKKYLERLALSRKPRTERLKTIGKCGSCEKTAVLSTD